VKPDWTTQKVELDLAGKATLSRARLAVLGPVDLVQDLKGAVTLKRIKATLVPGENTPAELLIEGTVDDASLTLASPSFSDTISSLSGHFVLRPDAVEMQGHGESIQLGVLRAEGRYPFQDCVWDGTVEGDVARLGTALWRNVPQRELVSKTLEAFGASTFAVRASFEGSPVSALRIQAVRQGNPLLEGTIALDRGAEGWKVGAIEASTTIPINALGDFLPPGTETEGAANIRLSRAVSEDSFTVRADLTQSGILAGKYLKKRPGDPAVVEVNGTSWTPRTARVTYHGVEMPLRLEDGRVIADNLDMDLTPFTPLMPEGGSMRGRVRGSFATSPLTAALTLHGVGFTWNPQIGVDSITGGLAYSQGHVTCRDVTIRGANSDCAVTAGYQEGAWRGQVTGRQFDLNAILAMMDAVKAFEVPSEVVGAPSSTSGVSGQFAVNVQSLFYKRARLDNVRADVTLSGDRIQVRNFSARPYAGTVSGVIDITRARKPVPGSTKLDLVVDGIDARCVDELLFAEPRNFSGSLYGTVALKVPTESSISAINGASGAIEFQARNGSFGQLGLATKLLTVLKTTEVFRLRLPSFKDEGLTYQACTGALVLKDGTMTIKRIDLVSPAFAMNALGTIDFPRQDSKVNVQVNLLESVTGIVRHVPVLGGAVSRAAGGVAQLNLIVEGSPYDPRVRVEPGRPLEKATKRAGDAAVGIVEGVIDGIRGTLK